MNRTRWSGHRSPGFTVGPLVRLLGRAAGWIVALVLLAPAMALVPAAVFDRGPSGQVRASLFPAALALLDPFFWVCARNSVGLAAAVAVGSLLVGVLLARLVVGRRFSGRAPLAALAVAPLVVPPAFGALGLRLIFGPSGPWRGAWEQIAALPRVNPHWDGWIGAFWAGLMTGAPLVALATAHALARVDPAGIDAARLEGAGHGQTWRRLVWPVVKPSTARAVAAVFTLTIAEPGAPLVLGLRRTLGFQLVEAVLGPDPAPRAAVLALATIALALTGRVLVLLWGGRPTSLAESPLVRPEEIARPRSLVNLLLLAGAVALAWLPILGLLGLALSPPADDAVDGMRLTFSAFSRLGRDPALRRMAANSVGLGLAVLAVAATVSRWSRGRRWSRVVALWAEGLPPLALGVGAYVLPSVLHLAATAWPSPPETARFLDALEAASLAPGILLILAVATRRTPFLARVHAAERDRSRSAPREAARQLGIAPATANRLASEVRRTPGWGTAVLTFALAATNLAPALVLVPTYAPLPIAPGVLAIADEPDSGEQRAATLAVCAIVLNLSALVLASRGPDGALGADFRG